MFDKKLAFTLAGIAVVAMLALSLGHLPESGELEAVGEAVSDMEVVGSKSSSEPETREAAYLMKELDGHIAVYAAGDDEPCMILDTLVRYLPDYDRILLSKGIPIYTSAELAALIEDYIS